MKNLTRRKLLHLLFSSSGLALTSANVISLPRIGKITRYKQEVRPGKVTSKDGTRIAFLQSSAGPPLILVYGTSSDHTRHRYSLPLKYNLLSMPWRDEDEEQVAIQSHFPLNASLKMS